MVPKKTAIQNMLEQNTTNMIFYEDSFAKTAFFTKEIPNWHIPIFYFDFDLQYTGFVRAGITPSYKNLTLLYPENDILHEDLKSVIEKISKKRSLVIIDSFNGFFNHLEGEKDLGRLINSFLMLLVSSGKHTKSTIIVGILSKLNDENKWILYNTGRHVIDNEHFTKIQLIRSENSMLAKVLNPDNSSHSRFIL
uniref:Uncharacterized protein n=2 Tax=environmental samples TaxID=651140 RepID=A0A075HJP5_9ARCH|nr:hypothetical protein [uncultured marine thaumarchaeote KM3_168_C06]AIF16621.1 hypothetical protein [uncultured marine thaumarchaeote KM3_74_F11]